jgi:ADP-heptose:LPS heptosyltransferase
MGDVAMSVQAVRNILDNNPNAQITLVTRPAFTVFFGNHERLKFHNIDLKGYHKGLIGLRRLYTELQKENFDFFLDWHNVLRSKIICAFFKFSKTQVFVINKDRKTKEAIVNKKSPLQLQKHSIQRYLDVALSASLRIENNFRFILPTGSEKKQNVIGIAPFAAHNSKEWGLENIEKLIQGLENQQTEILLFGGGEKEVLELAKLEQKYPFCKSVAGQYKLNKELEVMSSCSIFIAMDSGNMHLASLVGVPTISLWFSTHPYLGFAPWGNEENCLQPSEKELPCRPASVFGKIKTEAQQNCTDKAKKLITPEMVLLKIREIKKKN